MNQWMGHSMLVHLKMTRETPEVRSDKGKPKMEAMEAMVAMAALAAMVAIIIIIIYWQKCSKSQKVAAAADLYIIEH